MEFPFDIDNPIEFGSALGFVEEAIKDEDNLQEEDANIEGEIEYAAESYAQIPSNYRFRMLYNDSPALACHLIKRFKESIKVNQNKIDNKILDIAIDNALNNNVQLDNVYEEMEEELRDIKAGAYGNKT